MPGSIRLFVNGRLHAAATVGITPGQAHYLSRVMRRAAGDPVLLFNGRDGEWQARIGGTPGVLEVERRVRTQASEPDLWLLFSVLKRDATELVVQKATELGASVIQPVLTERSNPARPAEARLSTIAIEAAEQCERLTAPAVSAPLPLRAVLADWPPDRTLVVAAERAAAPPVPRLAGPAGLLIGPEGGFAPAELDDLLTAPFVVPASLGPRILRAETAAIVGLTLLQANAAG